MNELTVFNFGSLPIRTYADENGEIWFCFRDIAKVLEISSLSDFKKRLNKKGCCLTATPTRGGKQNLTYVNEGNLYRLVCRSDKPQARPFENWVYDEVLPTIRKTGSYGIVKSASVVSMDEIKKSIAAGIKDLFCSERNDKSESWELSDSDILYQLHCWHSTRNKVDVEKMRELIRENEELRKRLAAIKQAVA